MKFVPYAWHTNFDTNQRSCFRALGRSLGRQAWGARLWLSVADDAHYAASDGFLSA